MKSKIKRGEKLSRFRGVSFARGYWVAQYQKARFIMRFDSEMAALAHFMTVYLHFNHDHNSARVKQTLGINQVWRGRPAVDEVKHVTLDPVSKTSRYQFPIDFRHVVRVSEPEYDYLKDWIWFVKDGVVLVISGYSSFDGNHSFSYKRMDSIIFSNADKRVYKDREVIRKDGDPFNMERGNLLKWGKQAPKISFALQRGRKWKKGNGSEIPVPAALQPIAKDVEQSVEQSVTFLDPERQERYEAFMAENHLSIEGE